MSRFTIAQYSRTRYVSNLPLAPSLHVRFAMILKIELIESESEIVFVLVGRITSPEVQELKVRIAEARKCVALDLQQVCVVDLDAVRFLAGADRRCIELRRFPRYVREWILLEKPRVGALE